MVSGITRVYIGNPANCDTCSHGYQPAGVDRRMMTSMLQEVGDMTSVVIQEPLTDPSQMTVGARSQPGRGASGGRPPVPSFPDRHEHVDLGHVEVESGEGSGGGQSTIDPFDNPNLDIPSFSLGLTPTSYSLPSGFGTSQMPPPSGLGFVSFQSPYSTSFGFFGFRAPPPPGIAGSSTPH
ncbi:hypothetical protein M9H77_15980 [Catharanthus roseus]|uniref:Uncharacterized protein n=1 Tax=Catharanthus roseus TaxID=4058 RepID=A0ACC0B032_CATRO|nr:hypothetical protein M9H77_15980 [Catharanthus roseus]